MKESRKRMNGLQVDGGTKQEYIFIPRPSIHHTIHSFTPSSSPLKSSTNFQLMFSLQALSQTATPNRLAPKGLRIFINLHTAMHCIILVPIALLCCTWCICIAFLVAVWFVLAMHCILTPRIRDSSSYSVTEKPGLTHYPTANTLSNG